MYRTCLKTRLWSYVHYIPYFSSLTWFISVAYGMISVRVAWVNCQDNTTTIKNGPLRDACMLEGPYAGKPQFVLLYDTPKDDYTVSKRKMVVNHLSKVLDPALDVNCMLAFLAHGQPFYFCGMFCAVFVPNSHDPLQTRGLEMLFSCLDRGFPVRGMYVVQKREGSYEGVLSLLVALHALMRNCYINSVSGWERLTIVLTAATSLFSALPSSAVARDLLFAEAQGICDFDDFYSVMTQKHKLGFRKYLPSVDALSFGIALAVTFQSNAMLVQLWLTGFFVGVLWWMFYWQLYVKASLPPVRGAMCFILAFLCWFLAPTRLNAFKRVQDSLFEGTLPYHQAALRGCASLGPGAYYFHRITTLSTFWIISIVNHRSFYNILINSIWADFDAGRFTVMCLLLLGWASLVLEFIIYYTHKDDFNMNVNVAEDDKGEYQIIDEEEAAEPAE